MQLKYEQKSYNKNLKEDSTNRPQSPGIETVFPPESCVRDLHTILPDWLLKNCIFPTQIVAIKYNLDLCMYKHITVYLDYAVLNDSDRLCQPQNFINDQKKTYKNKSDNKNPTNKHFSTN